MELLLDVFNMCGQKIRSSFYLDVEAAIASTMSEPCRERSGLRPISRNYCTDINKAETTETSGEKEVAIETIERDLSQPGQRQSDLLKSSIACGGGYPDLQQQQPESPHSNTTCGAGETAKKTMEEDAVVSDFQQEQYDSLLNSMACGGDYTEIKVQADMCMSAVCPDAEASGDTVDSMQGGVLGERCESGFNSDFLEEATDSAGVDNSNTAAAAAPRCLSPTSLPLPDQSPDEMDYLLCVPFDEVEVKGPDDGCAGPIALTIFDTSEQSGSELGEEEELLELSSMDNISPSAAFDEEDRFDELSSMDNISPLAAFDEEFHFDEQQTDNQRIQNLVDRIGNSNVLLPMAIGPPRVPEIYRTDFQHGVAHVPFNQRYEAYCWSIPEDQMEFMNFRQMCEDELRGNPEYTELLQEQGSTQLSLEARRKDYKDLLPSLPPLSIRRANAVRFMLNRYKTIPDFHRQKLMINYYDNTSLISNEEGDYFEEGIDLDGMTRDLFANVWKTSKVEFKETVPLSVGYTQGVCPNKCQCELMAKASFHSYLLTRQIPKYIPELAVMGMFCSNDKITDPFLDDITEIFVNEQVQIVKNAILQAQRVGIQDTGKEHLQMLSDHYGAPPPPKNPQAFQEWLRALVLDGCVNNPNHFVTIFSKFREEILGYSTPSDAKEMYKTLHPMRSDVLDLLHPINVHTTERSNTFEFLKSFLLTCPLEIVNLFLLFCTGSESLTEASVDVEFYSGKGYLLASTCFNTIKIPTGYDEFKEFEERMSETLSHPENFKFNRA